MTVKLVMDGAPERFWLVEEDRQQQRQGKGKGNRRSFDSAAKAPPSLRMTIFVGEIFCW
jgi:hypothetical protein